MGTCAVLMRDSGRRSFPGCLCSGRSSQLSRIPAVSRRAVGLILMIATCFWICGCSGSDVGSQSEVKSGTQPSAAPDSSSDDTVLVTAWPLFDMTRFIAGDHLNVEPAVRVRHAAETSDSGTLKRSAASAGNTDSPNSGLQTAAATQPVSRLWRPKVSDVKRMQSAVLIVMNGADYEPWQQRVSLPRSRVLVTTKEFSTELIEIPDAVVHQHGPEGGHSHPGTVWATWMDPELASRQSQQIASSLVARKPEHQQNFDTRAAQLQQQLRTLDDRIQQLAEKKLPEDFAVLGDGPYYQYIVRRLGWKFSYLHWPEADQPISDSDASTLKAQLNGKPSRLFLMMSRRDTAAEQRAVSAGLRVVRIDLCETAENEGRSFPERMQENLNRLADAVSDL
jgi:zinc transport system substrate-binding protein